MNIIINIISISIILSLRVKWKCNDVGLLCKDVGSEECTREEGGCCGWMNGVTKLDRIRNERIRGKRKWEKYPRKCRNVGRSDMGVY